MASTGFGATDGDDGAVAVAAGVEGAGDGVGTGADWPDELTAAADGVEGEPRRRRFTHAMVLLRRSTVLVRSTRVRRTSSSSLWISA
jgi:hypothetical protein